MPKPTSMKEIESKNKNKKGKKDEPVEKKDVETEDKEMTNEIIEMIQQENNFGSKSLVSMLDAKTSDKDQKIRVMKRVKLMLDPDGSTLGKDIPMEDIENMTEEERRQYESDLIMRGMGNKCLKKFCETMIYAAVCTSLMYYTGALELMLRQMNPELFPNGASLSTGEPSTLAELERSEL